MLLAIVIFVILWAGLTGILWAGTSWFQGYIYSEPQGQLYWRAPAAAGALTAWLTVWTYLDARNPGRYGAVFDFSATEVKKFDELWVVKDNKKVHYKAASTASGRLPGRIEFRETGDPRHVWSRSPMVIVKEDGEEVRFDADMDKDNHYKIEQGRELRYRDGRGRVMTEGAIGRVSSFRWGVFLTYVVLNLGFFAVWFLCLWLLMNFQLPHALGIAAIFWVALTVFIVPMLLNSVENAVAKRPAPTRTSAAKPTGCAPWVPA